MNGIKRMNERDKLLTTRTVNEFVEKSLFDQKRFMPVWASFDVNRITDTTTIGHNYTEFINYSTYIVIVHLNIFF